MQSSSNFNKKYKDQRDRLKQRFENEKTGDQTLFIDQSKLFKPLIDAQNESSKNIENQVSKGQDLLSDALIPFTRELQKRNEQVDNLQNLPYYNAPLGIEDVAQSTPQKDQTIHIDLDGGLLNTTDTENLQDMGFPLPSVVQVNGNYDKVLEEIKSKNKSIGQYLRADSKKMDKEKEVYKSQKETLKKYKEKMIALKISNEQFTVPKKTGKGLNNKKLVKPKRGRGRPKKNEPDPIIYISPYDLCQKLHYFWTEKKAGNTGLDNIINSILDELLEIKKIDKTEYNNLYKNIFST